MDFVSQAWAAITRWLKPRQPSDSCMEMLRRLFEIGGEVSDIDPFLREWDREIGEAMKLDLVTFGSAFDAVLRMTFKARKILGR